MHDANYPNPKHPIQLENIRIAVVIPCFIPTGQEKQYGYYLENKLDTVKMNLAAHDHYRPGLTYSLLLYDNSSPDREGRKYLKEQGAKVRDNFGYGFGAWKQAWEDHKDEYDFFLFTEDDIAPACDDWLLMIMRKFFEAPGIGAVGSFLEGRSPNEAMSEQLWEEMKHQYDMMYNFDGAFTFTSAKVLRQVDAIGGLLVFPCNPGDPYWPTFNECVFQDPILQLGYTLTSFDDGDYCVIHGSEVFTGDICNPDKPLCPLTNLNGRWRIPKVAEHYAWYLNPEHESS